MRIYRLFTVFMLITVTACSPSVSRPEPEAVGEKVKAVFELPTVEHVYRDIVYIGEESKFLGFSTLDKRLLFSVDVKVQAGFKLADAFAIQKGEPGELIVTLPEPSILLIDADESTIEQFFIKEWGGRIGRLEYYDEIERSKRSIREESIQRGILEKARNNGYEAIRSLSRSLGYERVRFISTGDSSDE